MGEKSYLHGLNPAQKEAVLHRDGPLLIIAGAGAGKTKTITHRIAHLIEEGVPGRQILAVTFTNKAAGEMRERVRGLLKEVRGELPLLTTFHSLGVRVLREFHEKARLPRTFSIWDRDDSLKTLKTALTAIGSDLAPKSVLAAISRAKGEGFTEVEYVEQARDRFQETVARAWDLYEKTLREEGALDFDDLLLRTLILLKNSAEIRSLLQNRWTYLTIDEYQDTNASQMEIARILAGEKQNICAVGDIDQCLVKGTKIRMHDGTERAIETIQVGDLVRSNYGSGDFRPARVSDVYSKETEGEIVSIHTRRGRTLSSTPEHIHFAGYRLGMTPQFYFTYLMHKQGKGFRLGVSQVYTKGQKMPMVGFQQRCNHEHADKLWIVGTHANMNDARILEYTLSMRYQIPTIPFVARKGNSIGGYVHDQKSIDALFASIDTERGGKRLLEDQNLPYAYPHHRAQSRNSSRRIVTITLCGDHRGKTPLHRIAMIGNDAEGRATIESLGFSVRVAKAASSSWRFESAHKDFRSLQDRVQKLQSVFPNLTILENARLGGKKIRPRDGNSLGFLPAESILPGMVVFDDEGDYDIVDSVRRTPSQKTRVYDLNVEGTHNFIANGLVTHNSIYTWRGADVEHLLSFEKTFPGTKMITLEENYRSTRTILAAANSVIEKNVRRKPKHLFTQNETGDPIFFYGAENEIDEAWFVAQSAAKLIEKGTKPRSIAVLYRENFQSRVLEEAFLHVSVPYRVLGTRFFERKEVKDVLSYLRAAQNPRAKTDLMRIIGVPPRGIGKVTLEKMLQGMDESFPNAARMKVKTFRDALASIQKAIETLSCSDAVHYAIQASGIEAMLKKDPVEGEERLGNVRELVNLSTKYDNDTPPLGIERLLEEAALQSEQDELDQNAPRAKEDAVSLMTVHASKGLEFDVVFVTGLEQGLFPAERQHDADRDPEEERRLFYVAVTRAAKRLYLSSARARMKYGSREYAIPSEFIDDIDSRLIARATSGARNEEEVIE